MFIFRFSIILFVLGFNHIANACDYEKILFNNLAEKYKSNEKCFYIDPREIEKTPTGEIELKIRETHNVVCGGSPGTTPVAGNYKVFTNTCEIFVYDIVEAGFEKLDY